ncbi:hypothetical protein [Empedobacter brevis]|uniref:Lipoprotein n=1 Tax=Empedobacter brevis NBRC 14943 = ATCC 43319 TaxID=1218108 RepID=A0A511NKX5_9FLAO|nr:hypothetical protein [Empedobacter brevis]GEM53443.1 hypothetical protein EB1_32330 [Empedobacter brevis NBRC 14943 = ATCC 43319]
MKKILLSILLISSFLTLSSCGDKKGGRNDLSEKDEIENSNSEGVVVILEGTFLKNDIFQLFYSNDTTFSEQKSIKTIVYGQSILQKVLFQLPKEVKPQSLRLDLGSNPNQTSVTIKKMEINYKDQILIMEGDTFRDYFQPTPSVEFDQVSLEYNLKPNEDGTFDPVLFGNDKVKKGLNKIYNELKEDK